VRIARPPARSLNARLQPRGGEELRGSGGEVFTTEAQGYKGKTKVKIPTLAQSAALGWRTRSGEQHHGKTEYFEFELRGADS
jgi:hypothetical protein